MIYGDTDSLFIQCQGSSFEKSFELGKQIVDSITKINPFPMELKFEKVYFPCLTLAKKRYCGYMYESVHDKPFLDCKGIETIRRDNVEALQKIMDSCLRILFQTKNISQCRVYLQK